MNDSTPATGPTGRPAPASPGASALTGLNHGLRRMTGRDPHEAGRVATPLELLFDLAFVAAFEIAGNQMAHLLAEGTSGQPSAASASGCSRSPGRG